jgi:DNA polymerase
MDQIDLTEFIQSPAGRIIPNTFPTNNNEPYKIAIIGEAPGKDEEVEGKPFVGASGRFLTSLLADSNIKREACFIGNCCQIRPPQNQLWKFAWNGQEIQSGLAQLRVDLQKWKPNLCVLMGKTALRAAKGTYLNAKGKETQFSLDDWKGSLFISDLPESPFFGLKCLVTYHPANLFRKYVNTTFVRFHLKRARKHGQFPELPEADLHLDIEPHLPTIIQRLRLIREHRIPFTIDIEGGVVEGMSCLSISPTEREAFIIPFTERGGGNFWTLDEEVELWGELAAVLEDYGVPKTLMNAMYDNFVFSYSYKTLIRNIVDDIMLKHWELFCELPQGLDTQTSIYTEHAYYKDERKAGDQKTFWSYCCKDSAITNQINQVQTKALNGGGLSHYRFNMDVYPAFLYIERKGMLLDQIKREQRIQQLGFLAKVDAKKKLSSGTEQLQLEQMVGHHLNTGSNQQMVKFLYDKLKLPPQYKERADGSETLTADFETLLFLGKKYKNETLNQCIKVRRIRKRTSDIEAASCDPDGRIRSSTFITGTVTGRTSSSAAPTGNGTNLHTIRDDDKDLFLADSGHDFGQMDLAGADGWTVACHCAKLGDSTMLEDYLYGLKPAKNVALMYLYGEQTNQKSRSELKLLGKDINAESDRIKEPHYLYFTCKRAQHGTNYRMGAQKLVDQIYLDTDGEIDIPVEMGQRIQRLYLLRYPGVLLWQDWIREQLLANGAIVCASGHKRKFFGRKKQVVRGVEVAVEETVGDACSEEPQHNTTWVTNTALKRLWYDPDNLDSNNRLKVWPCHQVHDQLCVQWRTEIREWALAKCKEFFNNPVMIAGQRIVIPYEGTYGPSWGEKTGVIE